MTNLITFSVNPDFIELEKRIKQIIKIKDQDSCISATVELLEDISRSTKRDSVAYATGMSEQLAQLGDVMAVYAMSKIWDATICGLYDVESDDPEKFILIDTDKYGNNYYRHPIDACKVKWLIEYELDKQ